jgi:hypothetical protein
MRRFLLFSLFTIVLSSQLFSQNFTLSGKVTDASTGEPLIGTNVYIKTIDLGGVSNTEGTYKIEKIKHGTYEVTVSFVGYISIVKNIEINSNKTLDFQLKPSPVLLQEAVVQGTRATLRETPVAFTNIPAEVIEFKLASRDLPQLLNITPSVYSSMQGGGAGDANLVIRGFNQRNVAIMINGVPVNDMENGWVYWSNWAGLGEVTRDIQVQRGLGASPYSVSSIGGVLNVLTYGASGRKEFTKFRQEVGSNGLSKTVVAFSSMLSDKIGLTGLVSQKKWSGYADQTWLNEFTYFFSIGGVFGNHSLELTGIGSPQDHGQRSFRQTIQVWNSLGFNYNPNMGYLFGKPLNEIVNKYHKPQFNLNWNWQVNPSSVLATTAYFSFGNGYGSGRLGSNWIYTPSGLIDFDAVWARNAANYNATTNMNQSVSVLRNSVNNHFWTGLLSTYKTAISNTMDLTVGIDGRYYLGMHYREIRNLLGGNYYLNTRNKNNPNQLARTGDKVDYYNDGKVVLYGGFAQLEYKLDKITTFLNFSGSNTGYQRIDYFNFLDSDPNQTTPWQNFLGYTAKAGANYNIDNNNNVFANVGYFSKAPIFDNVFDFANNVYADAVNEKILGVELGYGFATPVVAFNINGFFTNWQDRAINQSYTFTDSITGAVTYYQANIVGASERHYGIEFEGKLRPIKSLEFNGMFSYSVNKYTDNVSARLYPEEDPSQVKEINSYVKDLYVSDFPMTTAALEMNYRYEIGTGTSFIFNPVYKFFGRYYAFFNPDSRSNQTDLAQSWRIPDYYLFDVHVAYEMLFIQSFIKKASVGLHIFNALNTKNYITDATDGRDHTQNTATVWYGRDRWYNVSVTLDF